MVLQPKTGRRAGAIVPLVAISLIAMMGMLALAIDLGTMAIARNQCQSIADATALGACRALNGDTATNNNSAGALAAGNTIATQNNILGTPVTSGQVNLTIGDYYYDPANHNFKINATGLQPPAQNYPTDNYCLAQATVNYQGTGFFSNIWSTAPYNTSATSTSAHNPRDAAIVQDFSGSMRFDSYFGAYNGRTQSQNPDTIYPTWGQYNSANAPGNFLQYTSDILLPGSGVCGRCNYSTTTADGPPLVNDFSYATTAFQATPVAWQPGGYWSPQPASYASTPVGDQPAYVNGGTSGNYARHVQDITGSGAANLNWELDGYSNIGTTKVSATDPDYTNAPFYGYTIGPGYWGKTFFLWPPDPRVPWDPYYYQGNGGNIQNVVKGFLMSILGIGAPAANSAAEGMYKNNTFAGSKNWPGSNGSNEWDLASLLTYINKNVQVLTPVTTARISRLYNRGGKKNGTNFTSPGMPVNGSGVPMACDWRERFFTNSTQTTSVGGNTNLDNGGNVQAPQNGGYLINYAAILDWIKNAGPNSGAGNIFPPQLRLGGVLYYSSIPADCYPVMPWNNSFNGSCNLGSNTANDGAQPKCDMALWQTYIDAQLGLSYTGGKIGSGLGYQVIGNSGTAWYGYRPDYAWGSPQSSAKPGINGSGLSQYMNYTDNPYRGNTKYWFGPLSFTDVVSAPAQNNGTGAPYWMSGTAHEAPTFQTKLGIQGALKDMQNNHPNDMVSLQFYSTAGVYYNYSKMPLSRNYNLGVNSEWFSSKMINGMNTPFVEITPFSGGGNDMYDIPRANGSTNFEFPAELAFNQFSANASNITYTPTPAPAGTSGGLGRTGATKLLIFETDGQINEYNNQSPGSLFVAGAQGTSYYKVRCTNYAGNGSLETAISVGGDNVTISASPAPQNYPRTMGGSYDSGSAGNVERVIEQMVNDQASNGFSTQHRPALVHCIAFGILFDPANPGYSYGQNSLKLLHNLEVLGSTQGTAAGNGTGAFYPNSIASNKIIYGSFQTRINNLQSAFQTIMQDAIQVTLISSNNNHTAP